MGKEKNTPLRIEKAANGFIVTPDFCEGNPNVAYTNEEKHVYNNLGTALKEGETVFGFIHDHFKEGNSVGKPVDDDEGKPVIRSGYDPDNPDPAVFVAQICGFKFTMDDINDKIVIETPDGLFATVGVGKLNAMLEDLFKSIPN